MLFSKSGTTILCFLLFHKISGSKKTCSSWLEIRSYRIWFSIMSCNSFFPRFLIVKWTNLQNLIEYLVWLVQLIFSSWQVHTARHLIEATEEGVGAVALGAGSTTRPATDAAPGRLESLDSSPQNYWRCFLFGYVCWFPSVLWVLSDLLKSSRVPLIIFVAAFLQR